MCSVGDDFYNESKNQEHMSSVVKPVLTDIKCNKCKDTLAVVLLRGKDAYCKNCFLVGINHKFKALLGKSKLICPNEKVMISYEIGHPSTALLHLIRAGLDLDTPKKLRFQPVFVFLEDQYYLSVNERNEAINYIIKEANNLNFKIYFISLNEWILTGALHLSENCIYVKEGDMENLNYLFNANTNKTNRKEVFNIIRRKALIDIAKRLECKFIFTPELSVDIASNLLTNMALGKGANISVDTGFCDDRGDSVKILRPLRMFDVKELAFYNTLHKLNPVSVRQPIINNYSSVQDLMTKFVGQLQDNYPATVTTIMKTGDKLATDTIASQKCKLCKGVIKKSKELDSEESTNFSKLVSKEILDHHLTRQERYRDIINKFDVNQCIRSEYCYSCSKISEYLLDGVGAND